MKRRGGSGQPVKGQSANRPKARNAPTAPVSTADLQEQLDRRTRERDEALQQLTANSEVLRVISRSAFDLKSVLQTLVESAARLCRADKAAITDLHTVAKVSGGGSQGRLVVAAIGFRLESNRHP